MKHSNSFAGSTKITVGMHIAQPLYLVNRFKYSFYLSRYLDQDTAKGLFWSSSQATTCYYQSICSKVEAIPLSALPKDTTSELAGLSPHYPFNAERQTGKL